MHYRSGVDLWKSRPPAAFTADPFIKDLADLTGGSIACSGRQANLRSTFTNIVTEFRNRYVLTYSPKGVAPGGWHPLDVRLKSGHGTLKARRVGRIAHVLAALPDGRATSLLFRFDGQAWRRIAKAS